MLACLATRFVDDSLPRRHRGLLDVQEGNSSATFVDDSEGIAMHRNRDIISLLSANWPSSYDERAENNMENKKGADMVRQEVLNHNSQESGDVVLIDGIRKKLQVLQNMQADTGYAETSALTRITVRLLDLISKVLDESAKRDVMEQNMSTTFRTILLAIQSGLGNVQFELSLPPTSLARRSQNARLEGWDALDENFLATDPWDGCQDLATEDFFDWFESCLGPLVDPAFVTSCAPGPTLSRECHGQDVQFSQLQTRHYVKRCFTGAETDAFDAHFSKLIDVMDVDCGIAEHSRWSLETASTIFGGSCLSHTSAWTAPTTNSLTPDRSTMNSLATSGCDNIENVHSATCGSSKLFGYEAEESSPPRPKWRFRRNKTPPT